MKSYDFPAKALYRQRRLRAIEGMCKTPKVFRTAAYLDTGEGLDTLSYLRAGYKPNNLYAINKNPAEVAVLTRHLRALGLPDVHTVGVDLVSALRSGRVPDNLDILDFDGMSQFHEGSWDLLEELAQYARHVGFTVLGGRERPDDFFYKTVHNGRNYDDVRTSFNVAVPCTHKSRIYAGVSALMGPRLPASACRTHVTRVAWDVYVSSSGQPMCWAMCKIEPHTQLYDPLNPKARAGKAWRVTKNTGGLSIPPCIDKLLRGEFQA